MEKETVLKIEHMNIVFTQYDRGMHQTELPVIRNLDVEVRRGEVVAVAGSSGSGKSLLAHGVMGVLPYNARMGGDIQYLGEKLTKERIEKLRGKEIVMVPQSISSLNPLMKIGPQIRKGKKDPASQEKLKAIFRRYDLEEKTEELYLELALETVDRIAVFYGGTTIEEARAEDFQREENLRHPYTKALWRAMPRHGFQYIEGSQPYVKNLPKGCIFSPRCSQCQEACRGEIPYREVRGGKVEIR